jgi:hypothetical protein
MATVKHTVSNDGVWIEFRSSDGSAIAVTATDLRVSRHPGFREKITAWAAEAMTEHLLEEARKPKA